MSGYKKEATDIYESLEKMRATSVLNEIINILRERIESEIKKTNEDIKDSTRIFVEERKNKVLFLKRINEIINGDFDFSIW